MGDGHEHSAWSSGGEKIRQMEMELAQARMELVQARVHTAYAVPRTKTEQACSTQCASPGLHLHPLLVPLVFGIMSVGRLVPAWCTYHRI